MGASSLAPHLPVLFPSEHWLSLRVRFRVASCAPGLRVPFSLCGVVRLSARWLRTPRKFRASPVPCGARSGRDLGTLSTRSRLAHHLSGCLSSSRTQRVMLKEVGGQGTWQLGWEEGSWNSEMQWSLRLEMEEGTLEK